VICVTTASPQSGAAGRSGFVLIDQIKKGPLAGPELGGGFSTAVNERKENGGDARVHSTDPAPSSQVNWL